VLQDQAATRNPTRASAKAYLDILPQGILAIFETFSRLSCLLDRRDGTSAGGCTPRPGEATAPVGAFGCVGCYEPVVRNPDSRDSFKQMPVAGHAFEWSPATILEADTGTGNEIPDGA
jgi:hypothetical protein